MEESKKPSRRRRTIIIFIVGLINAGLLTVILIALLTPARNAGQSDPLIGRAAPNFALAALNPGEHGTISLSDYKGKPVVLNMWSSTCAPCAEEAPLLERQWQQARGQGVIFLGIDFQDSLSGAQKFIQQYAVTYPNVLDASGTTTLAYGVTGLPETLFIDRQGMVVSRVIGELTPQALQSNLQVILH